MKTMTVFRIAAALLLGAASLSASALQRTFVASFGSDANPCTITSPCRGFARALTQSDAGGEVIVLDSAGYGPVIINQSVSIIAPEGIYAGISVFSGNGITIIGGGKVALRGLTINGQGGSVGILVQSGFAGDLFVERCFVSNLDLGISITPGNARVFVERSAVKGNAFQGILVSGGAGGANFILTVSDSTIARNGQQGIGLSPLSTVASARLSVARTVVDSNAADGLRLEAEGPTAATCVLRNNAIVNNGGSGIRVVGSAPNIVVAASDNLVSGHLTASGIAPSSGVVIAERNLVTRNGTGLNVLGGVIKSPGNNVVENNTTDVSGSVTSITFK